MPLRYWNDYQEMQLGPVETQVMHGHVPFIMVAAGINTITDKTIPLIVERLALTSPGWGEEIEQLLNKPFVDFLKQCIGMKCNICNERTQHWVRRLNLTKVGPAELEKLCQLPQPVTVDA